jgi:hypothetical protein
MGSVMLFALQTWVLFSVCAQALIVSRQELRRALKPAVSALAPQVQEKLEQVFQQYGGVKAMDSSSSTELAQQGRTLAEKYGTYLEVKKMMSKFRLMYQNEASDQRKARQLKSFVTLYKKKLELEDLLHEQCGVPLKRTPADGLAQLTAVDKRIAELEGKLKQVEVKLPKDSPTCKQVPTSNS